jgi:hypothetical protein
MSNFWQFALTTATIFIWQLAKFLGENLEIHTKSVYALLKNEGKNPSFFNSPMLGEY